MKTDVDAEPKIDPSKWFSKDQPTRKEMKREIRVLRSRNYDRIRVLFDDELSWTAKAIFCFLIEQKEGKNVRIEELKNPKNEDLTSAVGELIKKELVRL